MAVDELFDDRQSEAGSPMGPRGPRIDLVERIENPREVIFRDAHAGVADGQNYGRPACREQRGPKAGWACRVDFARLRTEDDIAAFAGELQCIVSEVEHDLLEPNRVSLDLRGAVGDLNVERDIATVGIGNDRRSHVGEQCTRVDRFVSEIEALGFEAAEVE